MQFLTDVDFPDSEQDSDNEHNRNEAKNVSGDQGHVMANENDPYNEDQGNESESYSLHLRRTEHLNTSRPYLYSWY